MHTVSVCVEINCSLVGQKMAVGAQTPLPKTTGKGLFHNDWKTSYVANKERGLIGFSNLMQLGNYLA